MEELVGPLTYVQGEAVALGDVTPEDESKGSFGGKSGFDKAMLGFLGSQKAPGVEFWLDGEVGENKMGASVGVKGLGGYAYLLDGFAGDMKLEPKGKEKTDFESYWNNRVARLSVHFPINGARLRAPTQWEWDIMFAEGKLSMKEALDTFAACELPLLAHPLAGIKIDAYADPPDDVDDNLELSRNRAITVTHYLHGLLADRLTWGRSYEELKADGRLVWEAHGEPDPHKKTPKQRRKEKHDPLLRRADVTVQIRDGVDVPVDRRSETGAAIQLLPDPPKKRP